MIILKPPLFVVLALMLFLGAYHIGTESPPWQLGNAISPNVMAGLTSLGLSIAGGLSLIAASIAMQRRD